MPVSPIKAKRTSWHHFLTCIYLPFLFPNPPPLASCIFISFLASFLFFYFTQISSALLIYFLSQLVSPSRSDPPPSCPALTRLALTSVSQRLYLQMLILPCPIVSFCTFLSTFLHSAQSYSLL